jgi:hypothetical protein
MQRMPVVGRVDPIPVIDEQAIENRADNLTDRDNPAVATGCPHRAHSLMRISSPSCRIVQSSRSVCPA